MSLVSCKHLQKILLSICFFLLSISFLLCYYNPAKGYELSIYKSTPWVVWFTIISCYSIGLFTIIYQKYFLKSESNFWIISLLIIILAKILLLSIPYLRGYYSWRADNIEHLGFIISDLQTGHIPAILFYPVMHIFNTELIYITNGNLLNVVNNSTTIISIYYIFCLYLLASSTLNSKREYILSAAIAGIVAFDGYHRYLMPNGWSTLYLPTFFYLYLKKVNPEKKYSSNYSILLVILLILYPYFHPLSSLMIIFLILIIEITRKINNQLVKAKNKYKLRSKLRISDSLTIIIIEVIIFSIWILSFKTFQFNLMRIYDAIISGSSPTNVIQGMSDRLNKVDVHGIELVKIILKIMGDDLIFLFLSFCSFMILAKNKDLRIRNPNLTNLFIMMLSIGLLYSLYLFNVVPGIENLGTSRLISYLVLFTPISVTFILNYFFKNMHKILYTFCIILILISSFISIFSLYDSPYVIRPNNMVTEMDIQGADWLTSSTIGHVKSVYIMSPLIQFSYATIGKTKSIEKYYQYEPQVPDHFNYTNNTRLDVSFSNRYILITKFDQLAYTTVWKNVGRFNKKDFVQMEQDNFMDKLYNNGESSIWFIR